MGIFHIELLVYPWACCFRKYNPSHIAGYKVIHPAVIYNNLYEFCELEAMALA